MCMKKEGSGYTKALPGLHLEGLDEGPQQDADGIALTKQLDEPSGTEQAEKAEVDEVVLQGRGCSLTFGSQSPACAGELSPTRHCPSHCGPKQSG